MIFDGTWDDEADVVVIGFGAAGAAAALAASAEGARTLILEKQGGASGSEPGEHLSTSHLSGGVFLMPTDRAATVRYFRELMRGSRVPGAPPTRWSSDELIDAYAGRAVTLKDWLHELGADISFISSGAEHPFPGVDTFESYRFKDSGLGMMRFFERVVRDDRNVEVRYEAPVQRLITDSGGVVVGVLAAHGDGTTRIRARRGVIMAMGGFEFDEDLKLNYLRAYPTYFTGSDACTGDGIRMAIEVGADLWHMNSVSARFVAKFPELPSGITMWMRLPAAKGPVGYLMVDKSGRRFINERFKPHTAYYETALFDSQGLDFPRIPSYWIFDSRRMGAAKLCVQTSGMTGPAKRYAWSAGNVEELRKGWIVEGATPAELAAKLDLDEPTLQETVEEWNRFCADGADRAFGRPADDLVPLDAPPYYAVALWPGGPNTQGGARRNSRAEIVDPFGTAIPGLYGAGEFGSMFGMLYPGGGGNLSECFVMGGVAGSNAAQNRR